VKLDDSIRRLLREILEGKHDALPEQAFYMVGTIADAAPRHRACNMATMHLDFVSQDRMGFSGEVSEVIAPGIEGQMGVLPRHAPLMTVLSPGEVIVRRPRRRRPVLRPQWRMDGGRPDHVTILARSAERSDEINLQRAEAARARAAQLLEGGVPREERTGIELALRRSQIRIRVGRRKGWRPRRPQSGRGLRRAGQVACGSRTRAHATTCEVSNPERPRTLFLAC